MKSPWITCVLVFVYCNLQVHAQLGLVAPTRLSEFARFTEFGKKVPHSSTLFVGQKKVQQTSSDNEENKIASIFKAAAYGTQLESSTRGSNATKKTDQPYIILSPKYISGSNSFSKQIPTENISIHSTNHRIPHHNDNKINYINTTRPATTFKIDRDVLYKTRKNNVSLTYEEADLQNNSVSFNKSINISKISTDEKYNLHIIYYSLGPYLWAHVYISAGLFTFMTCVSLCIFIFVYTNHSMQQPNWDIYFMLYILIIFSLIRCINLFLDPYGMEERLNVSMYNFLEEFPLSCLTAATAIVLLTCQTYFGFQPIVLRYLKGRRILTVLVGLHIISIIAAHVVANHLPLISYILLAIVQTVSASWAIVVGICGTWSILNIKGNINSQNVYSHSNLAYLIFVAFVSNLSLGILQIYYLMAPKAVFTNPWSWLMLASVNRILELMVVGSLLITATLLSLGFRKSNLKSNNRNDSHYIENNTRFVNAFSNEINKENSKENLYDKPLTGGFDGTFVGETKSLLNLSDYQNVLHSERLIGRNTSESHISRNAWHRSSMLIHEKGFVRFKTNIDPHLPNEEVFSHSVLGIQEELLDNPTPIANRSIRRSRSHRRSKSFGHSSSERHYEKIKSTSDITRFKKSHLSQSNNLIYNAYPISNSNIYNLTPKKNWHRNSEISDESNTNRSSPIYMHNDNFYRITKLNHPIPFMYHKSINCNGEQLEQNDLNIINRIPIAEVHSRNIYRDDHHYQRPHVNALFEQNRSSNTQFQQNRSSNTQFQQNRSYNTQFQQNRSSDALFEPNRSSNAQFEQNRSSNDLLEQNRSSNALFEQNRSSGIYNTHAILDNNSISGSPHDVNVYYSSSPDILDGNGGEYKIITVL